MKHEQEINGPWEIGETCSNAFEIRDAQAYKVCDVMNDDQGDITFADECRAHLIVGAPKMLEFLHALKKDCENSIDTFKGTRIGDKPRIDAHITLGCVTRLLSEVEL